MLRPRSTRREQPLDTHLPDPIIDSTDGPDTEHEALLADSGGLALLVVLETLTPAERLAFVLHDMFAVPFEQIAPIVERCPEGRRPSLRQGLLSSRVDLTTRRALINGAAGMLTFPHGKLPLIRFR